MGWLTNLNYPTTKSMLDAVSRPTDAYEIVWHSGTHYIYRHKETGLPEATTFLTEHPRGKGPGYKPVSTIVGQAMASKYITLAEAYYAKGNKPNAAIDSLVADARHEIEYHMLRKRLTRSQCGDLVYVSDYYEHSGWCMFHMAHKNRVEVKIDGNYLVYPLKGIDVFRTFGKTDKARVDEIIKNAYKATLVYPAECVNVVRDDVTEKYRIDYSNDKTSFVIANTDIDNLSDTEIDYLMQWLNKTGIGYSF